MLSRPRPSDAVFTGMTRISATINIARTLATSLVDALDHRFAVSTARLTTVPAWRARRPCRPRWPRAIPVEQPAQRLVCRPCGREVTHPKSLGKVGMKRRESLGSALRNGTRLGHDGGRRRGFRGDRLRGLAGFLAILAKTRLRFPAPPPCSGALHPSISFAVHRPLGGSGRGRLTATLASLSPTQPWTRERTPRPWTPGKAARKSLPVSPRQ
jgi:hypothetical protein